MEGDEERVLAVSVLLLGGMTFYGGFSAIVWCCGYCSCCYSLCFGEWISGPFQAFLSLEIIRPVIAIWCLPDVIIAVLLTQVLKLRIHSGILRVCYGTKSALA